MKKKLYRSRKNRIIGGVCAGIAEYFDIDPTIVRFVWLFLAVVTNLFGGMALILYIASLFIVPNEPLTIENKKLSRTNNGKILGIIILVIFIVYTIILISEKLIREIDLRFFTLGITFFLMFWPAVLIIAAILIVMTLKKRVDK